MKQIVKAATLTMFIFVVGYGAGHAQEKLRFKLGYNFNMPVGSFKDFISNTSYRGFHGEFSYPISEKFNVGLGASYNDYYQKFPRQVYKTNEGDISAVVTNSVQTLPLLAKASYNLTKQGMVRPYVGVGAGFNFISYDQLFGEFSGSRTFFKPAFNGNAGVNIPVGVNKGVDLNLGAHFNYMPLNYNGIKTLNNWGVNAGVSFPLR